MPDVRSLIHHLPPYPEPGPYGYRAKTPPPLVQAIRFAGKTQPIYRWREDVDRLWFVLEWDQPPRLFVETDHGQIETKEGHWIVRTPAGIIVMSDAVFQATYEEAFI